MAQNFSLKTVQNNPKTDPISAQVGSAVAANRRPTLPEPILGDGNVLERVGPLTCFVTCWQCFGQFLFVVGNLGALAPWATGKSVRLCFRPGGLRQATPSRTQGPLGIQGPQIIQGPKKLFFIPGAPG